MDETLLDELYAKHNANGFEAHRHRLREVAEDEARSIAALEALPPVACR
ncbi:MAG: hypothetical protein IPJ87_00005 [Flavobacteriales bacterium]|nr:hypothetical protein [Flavobacteriales bacterium]